MREWTHWSYGTQSSGEWGRFVGDSERASLRGRRAGGQARAQDMTDVSPGSLSRAGKPSIEHSRRRPSGIAAWLMRVKAAIARRMVVQRVAVLPGVPRACEANQENALGVPQHITGWATGDGSSKMRPSDRAGRRRIRDTEPDRGIRSSLPEPHNGPGVTP
jgi:hypothetical protein